MKVERGGTFSSSAGTPLTATMRPRSIGTLSKVALGADLAMAPENGTRLSGLMSRKKKLGTVFGNCASS